MSPRRLLAYFIAIPLLSLPGCAKRKGTPTAAAQTFLEQVAGGHTDVAYETASFFFKAQENPKSFAGTAKQLGLIGGKDLALAPLESDARQAKLDLSLTSAEGKKLQFVVTMIDESGGWRIYSIRTPRDSQTGLSENEFSLVGKYGGFNDAFAQPMPTQKTIDRIVREAITHFAQAIRQRSFKDFYDDVSLRWQSELTLKQLQRAFQGYIDNDVDMSGVADTKPIYDGPAQMTVEGLLVVSGYYPTHPMEVVFNFKYTYEFPTWKLFGVTIDLRKAPEDKAAPADEKGARSADAK